MSDRSSGSPDDSADTHPEPGDVGSVIPALPTTGTPNPAASGAPTSDDPRVDDALSRLGEVETLPLAEQVEVFTDIHRRLAAVLADPDSRA